MGTCASQPQGPTPEVAAAIRADAALAPLQTMAMVHMDRYGQIVYASASCEQVGGVGVQELVGTTISSHAHPAERSKLDDFFRDASSPSAYLSGRSVQLRYQRAITGMGGGTYTPLVFRGEWTLPRSGGSLGPGAAVLVGFERQLELRGMSAAEIAELPVSMEPTDPAPDAGPSRATLAREREAAARKEAEELAARRAVRSAYHELTNSLHAINTVALSIKETAASMKAEGDWRVENTAQFGQDVADLVAGGRTALVVSREIRVLDGDVETGSDNAFAVVSSLRSLCESLLGVGECRGVLLVVDESTPHLPLVEGPALLDAAVSAISHAMRLAGSSRVLVLVGSHPETGRLTLEVVHQGDGDGSVSMADIKADLAEAGKDAGDGAGGSTAEGLPALTGTRAQRLRLMAAVTTRVAAQVDGTLDMMEHRGVFRFALSLPWAPSATSLDDDTGVAPIERAARAEHAAAEAAGASAFAAEQAAGDDAADDAPGDDGILCLSSVPVGLFPDEVLSGIHRDAAVASLLPQPEGPVAAAARDTRRADRARTRAERARRRAARKAERAGAAGPAAAADAPALVGHPEWEVLRHKHILLVDDVASVRMRGEQALKRLGCTFQLLADGDEIEGAIRESPRQFDAILLDIFMARTNGTDVCNHLRKVMKFARPIVAMTGFTSPADVVKYFDRGFDVVLGKPFTVKQVADKLVEAFQRRGNAPRIMRVAAVVGDSGSRMGDSRDHGPAAAAAASASASGAANMRVRGGASASSGVRAGSVHARVEDGGPSPLAGTGLDRPVAERGAGLAGRPDALDMATAGDEPVLGLQRGATVAYDAGSRRGAAAFDPSRRAQSTAVGGGSSRTGRIPAPGEVDA